VDKLKVMSKTSTKQKVDQLKEWFSWFSAVKKATTARNERNKPQPRKNNRS
jgi:hypothetical protein